MLAQTAASVGYSGKPFGGGGQLGSLTQAKKSSVKPPRTVVSGPTSVTAARTSGSAGVYSWVTVNESVKVRR